MTAYNINDNNYIRLRDIGKAVNFGVTYDSQTDTVQIDSKAEYKEEHQSEPVLQTQTELIPITEKIVDGTEWARENFSLQANPVIFDEVYTRGAYNALMQSIVDIDTIVANTDEKGFNPYYKYANYVGSDETRGAMDAVLGRIFGYYTFYSGLEPYVKNRYDYKGYNICKPDIHDFYAPANEATDSFIKEVNALPSDREKVIKLNSYLCSKLTYGYGDATSPNTIFTSDTPLKGICSDYSDAFNYLCQRANIPCITIAGENHSWNMVYIESKWLFVDVCNNDVGNDPKSLDSLLLTEIYPKKDEDPKTTIFVQELLIPSNSTTK